MRVVSSAPRAAAMALDGGGAAGWPTSMCTMRRPWASSRAAAAITSITMNGATALPAAALAASVGPAAPQDRARGLPLIRDAEIEQLLREYTQPILRVAGLAQQNIQVVIINERSFNAFVADGRRIFVNVGALMEAKT